MSTLNPDLMDLTIPKTGRQRVLLQNSLFWAMLISFTWAYLPVWKNLVMTWASSEDYSHGFLILPLFIYSIWSARQQFPTRSLRPAWWGLPIILTSLLLYVFAYHSEIITLASITIILLFCGTVLYLYGPAFLRSIAFPILFLAFMIPIPSQIYARLTIPLQLLVTKLAVIVSSFLGIPTYIEGNIIHIPDLVLEVVNACSGLRSITTLMALSLLVGYFTLRRTGPRITLILASVPLSIFVNVIRLVTMILFFRLWGIRLTDGIPHTVFGVFMFLFSLALIFVIRGAILPWDRAIQKN